MSVNVHRLFLFLSKLCDPMQSSINEAIRNPYRWIESRSIFCTQWLELWPNSSSHTCTQSIHIAENLRHSARWSLTQSFNLVVTFLRIKSKSNNVPITCLEAIRTFQKLIFLMLGFHRYNLLCRRLKRQSMPSQKHANMEFAKGTADLETSVWWPRNLFEKGTNRNQVIWKRWNHKHVG